MIKEILDKFKAYIGSNDSGNNQKNDNNTIMPGDLKQRIEFIKKQFASSSDVVFREFEIQSMGTKTRAFLFYIDGLVDKSAINEFILNPLMLEGREADEKVNLNQPNDAFNSIKNHMLSSAGVEEAKSYEEMIALVLCGDTALLIDGHPISIIVSTRSWEHRTVNEPISEAVVRGPHEGFVETLRINTSLLRRKIKSANLKMESLKIGKYTQTDVVIAYIQGIADPDVVKEVKERLGKIKIDGILESGYLEEFIEDNPYSPFPQIEHTERPDKVAGSLLEGRIAIITDGTPFVLIVPVVFWSLLQASEDYYERYLFSSFTRGLRIFSALVCLIGPSVYIAVITYHQEMLPTGLLLSIASQREGVPFPAVVEAFLLEFAFEVIREGGIRLPRPVGQAVSIVGALIIGQAAVQAGLVSASMVIVVALTGIASFTIPAFSVGTTFRLLRFPLMIAASVLGFYGVMLGLLLILTHMCSLRSFGVPYLSPIAPLHYQQLKDVPIRSPWWSMLRRPKLYKSQDITRQRPMRGRSK